MPALGRTKNTGTICGAKKSPESGDCSSWRSYIGVVYADGNAMGSTVQALGWTGGLSSVQQHCRRECSGRVLRCTWAGSWTRRWFKSGMPPSRIMNTSPCPPTSCCWEATTCWWPCPPTALSTSLLQVTREFERLTREKIAALKSKDVRQFFTDRLGDRGFTISCGVAIASSTHPFHLSLDLAEQLLKNAKRSDSGGASTDAHSPARIDFHVVAGANSHALESGPHGDLSRIYRCASNVAASGLLSVGVVACRRVEAAPSRIPPQQAARASRGGPDRGEERGRAQDPGHLRRAPDTARGIRNGVHCGTPSGSCAQLVIRSTFHGSERTVGSCCAWRTSWMPTICSQSREGLAVETPASGFEVPHRVERQVAHRQRLSVRGGGPLAATPRRRGTAHRSFPARR